MNFLRLNLLCRTQWKEKFKKRTIVVYILAGDFASTSKQKNEYSWVFLKSGAQQVGDSKISCCYMCFYKQISEVLYNNSQFLEWRLSCKTIMFCKYPQSRFIQRIKLFLVYWKELDIPCNYGNFESCRLWGCSHGFCFVPPIIPVKLG